MKGIDSHEIMKQAKPGTIVPVIKVVNKAVDPVNYFAKISDNGEKPNSILLESADIVPKYGENSLGSAAPCLNIRGKNENFEITALNSLGKKFIEFLKGELDFCDNVSYKKEKISGMLKPARSNVSESERLKLKTHIDIIRAVAFKFKPTIKPLQAYGGLFGALAYDFIDQFEDLPKNHADLLDDPDYEMNFVDNLFLMDHKQQKTYLIANALIFDDSNIDEIYSACEKKISEYEDFLTEYPLPARRFAPKKGKIVSDCSQKEFEGIVGKVKQHILEGDVFQAVVSSTLIADYNASPLDVYKALRELNPSPYMFYFNNSNNVLLGSSPEMCISVKGDNGKKCIQIRPIAGTKPRGLISGKIDPDLDSRYETELKLDEKELAEHTMLVDLARNDVARVSLAGTRVVDEPYIVEKYSHVQHLVSNVTGTLKPEYDALHAYLASMNMGTLTGAPKVEAMKIIRNYEKNRRGFYGGAVLYITPSGDLLSTIVIRAMELKDKKAYIRAGAGIVHDSVPEKEFLETQSKAQACISAIKKAGGVVFE